MRNAAALVVVLFLLLVVAANLRCVPTECSTPLEVQDWVVLLGAVVFVLVVVLSGLWLDRRRARRWGLPLDLPDRSRRNGL